MTDKLPPNLLALFAPRPPLRYLPPSDHAAEERKTANITGVAQYLDQLHQPDDSYKPTESWLQRRDRIKSENKEKQEKHLTEGFAKYDPANDSQVRGDAFKTLFVARLSYDAKESDLEREFGRFGPIERIRIVHDSHAENPKKAHKGYAFIVYEREKDMKAAYKETDGIRIKDRRVLVDVERGRTVKGWKPRRFGGGLGGRGYTKAVPPRPSGPGALGAPSGPGGFRSGGGFRGGFGRGGGFKGDRPGGPRGGVGYSGGGGFGGRHGGPPPNAPSGPGGSRSGGFGGYGGAGANGGYGDSRGGRYDDSRSYRDRGYGDRDGGRHGSGSNREPVRPRDGAGYRDRDRDGGYGGGSRYRDDDHSSRKRYHDGDAYDDPRSKRRY